MPEVSVIIPTYNRSQTLKKAVKSVQDQTYRDFEIIIVDDGSTDNTKEVVYKLKRGDKRIRYIKHNINKGYPQALNTGIKISKGQYIAFQDDDDIWYLSKLERQVKEFKLTCQNIGVVYTGFWKETEKCKNKIYIPYSWVKQKEGNIHNELLKYNFVGTPTALVRRECFEKVGGFDTNLQKLQDWEMWIRISKYYKFKYIDSPLMISYYSNISVNKQPYIITAKALKRILIKHLSDYVKFKDVLANKYYEIGVLMCLGHNFNEGRGYIIKAMKTYPTNIKYLLFYLLLLFGQRTFMEIINIYRKIKK